MSMIASAVRCLAIAGLWGLSPLAAADPPAEQSEASAASTPTEEIVVKAPRRGYRSDNVTNVGPFKGMRLQDAPYSIGVTPGALIENRNRAHCLGCAADQSRGRDTV